MAKLVTPEEVMKRIQTGEEVNIIDVREKSETAADIIPGAEHIPLGQLVLRKSELDQGKDYIITCQSGNRSKAACGIMEALGYKVEDMAGGMNAWSGKTE
ncbi:rhodanese-like domain-containing protein [Cytobacillus gottheilii]|uniref:rhodanese-like domain-containing protein n=1 Tax=Cytobacillus gottheilii TaxID=859144 RepID=UPI00249521C8|nr:rhodanese-like domain-containing protein [Cytobacillus gottheilii]